MQKNESFQPQTTEPLEAVHLVPGQGDRMLYVGKHLPSTEKSQIINYLRENADVFAWSHRDLVGIDPAITCH